MRKTRRPPHSSANAPVAEGSFTGNGVVSALPRAMTFLCVPSPRTTICSKHSWQSLTCSPSRRILPSPHIEEHMEPASEAEQSDRASASSLTPGTAGAWQTPGTAGAWLSAPGTSGAWPLGGISSASPNCTLLFFFGVALSASPPPAWLMRAANCWRDLSNDAARAIN